MYEIIIGGVLITIILIVIIYMMVRSPYPAGLTEGTIIRCEATGGIYKLEGGKKRWFDAGPYTSAGLPPWKAVACNVVDSIKDGVAM